VPAVRAAGFGGPAPALFPYEMDTRAAELGKIADEVRPECGQDKDHRRVTAGDPTCPFVSRYGSERPWRTAVVAVIRCRHGRRVGRCS
jgi:hypothetical protein